MSTPPTNGWLYDLECRGCGRVEPLSISGIFEFLRRRRKIRADSDADAATLTELFLSIVPRARCQECQQAKLVATPSKEDAEETWEDVGPVLCEDCKDPIHPERLKILPGTRVCVRCQQQRENGGERTESDYCPRCGAPMRLRPSNDDRTTRWISVCSAGCRAPHASRR
ncbi:MAG: TraR/DksA C4-type zinc finger protein [Thermoguttaceae bacterium]|nr:TraR/DksA C4-type zinc finger protein [Thermoguttaceae bacterium]